MSVAHGHRLLLIEKQHGTEQFLEIASGHEQVRDSFADRILRVTSQKSLAHARKCGARDLDACLRDKAKLQRAYGGCLGNQKR